MATRKTKAKADASKAAPKAASKAAPKADAAVDPDKLVRQKAGAYRTADDRFEVQEGEIGWFVIDSSQTNEFGQPLMQGPFGTLKAVRDALPGARKTMPLPRGAGGGRKPSAASKRVAAKDAATPKPAPAPQAAPPSWIDRLPRAEASEVRALLRALEQEGVPDPEELVRSDRKGLLPAVASRLIERRLDALVDGLPPHQRDDARRLAGRVAEILTAEGATLRSPLPRWLLVEVGPHPEPPNRRIAIRRRR